MTGHLDAGDVLETLAVMLQYLSSKFKEIKVTTATLLTSCVTISKYCSLSCFNFLIPKMTALIPPRIDMNINLENECEGQNPESDCYGVYDEDNGNADCGDAALPPP